MYACMHENCSTGDQEKREMIMYCTRCEEDETSDDDGLMILIYDAM